MYPARTRRRQHHLCHAGSVGRQRGRRATHSCRAKENPRVRERLAARREHPHRRCCMSTSGERRRQLHDDPVGPVVPRSRRADGVEERDDAGTEHRRRHLAGAPIAHQRMDIEHDGSRLVGIRRPPVVPDRVGELLLTQRGHDDAVTVDERARRDRLVVVLPATGSGNFGRCSRCSRRPESPRDSRRTSERRTCRSRRSRLPSYRTSRDRAC